jgi:hypothetical protein
MYLGLEPLSASYLTDYLSGDNTTVAYTLSRAPVSASSVVVTISGVKQAASTYGVNGTTLTFSAAPPTGTNNIEVLHLGVQPDTVVLPSYRTITEFTATAGQTSFSPASYTPGYIDVFRNGVKLGTANFTATNGTTVVLNNACSAGDLVRFEAFLITSFNDAIPNTAGAIVSSNIANGVTINFADGSASTPSITNDGDNNTGIFFPAADTIAFAEGGVESARFDSNGNLGIGTSSPGTKVDAYNSSTTSAVLRARNDSVSVYLDANNGYSYLNTFSNHPMLFGTNNSERMRITATGLVGIGCTPTGAIATTGITLGDTGWAIFTRSGDIPLYVNRQGNDGELVRFDQANTQEGSISVSGTTVSYNGGHLARYAQTVGVKDNSILKGTVLSNLDEMNEYVDVDGNQVDNEQLNKVKVSDVEGDVNVAGVFVNWSHDDAHNVDEINMAMTGDMIIRIAEGVTVQRGDLLMSAGDGTAKPQGDDIVRTKTIAKVTSTHITSTYADGSYCVPCVLMAC